MFAFVCAFVLATVTLRVCFLVIAIIAAAVDELNAECKVAARIIVDASDKDCSLYVCATPVFQYVDRARVLPEALHSIVIEERRHWAWGRTVRMVYPLLIIWSKERLHSVCSLVVFMSE